MCLKANTLIYSSHDNKKNPVQFNTPPPQKKSDYAKTTVNTLLAKCQGRTAFIRYINVIHFIRKKYKYLRRLGGNETGFDVIRCKHEFIISMLKTILIIFQGYEHHQQTSAQAQQQAPCGNVSSLDCLSLIVESISPKTSAGMMTGISPPERPL